MYLHHLTDSYEAGERLESFFRWARGRRTPAVGADEIPTTVLKADDNVVIRLELRAMELKDVRVEDDAVLIKLYPRDKSSIGNSEDGVGRRPPGN